jgi:hypothetical protein
MRSIGDNKRRGAEVGLCALLEERSCIEWVSLGEGRMLEPHQVDGLHLGRGIGQRRERELLTKKMHERVGWGEDFLGRSMELSTKPREMWLRKKI